MNSKQTTLQQLKVTTGPFWHLYLNILLFYFLFVADNMVVYLKYIRWFSSNVLYLQYSRKAWLHYRPIIQRFVIFSSSNIVFISLFMCHGSSTSQIYFKFIKRRLQNTIKWCYICIFFVVFDIFLIPVLYSSRDMFNNFSPIIMLVTNFSKVFWKNFWQIVVVRVCINKTWLNRSNALGKGCSVFYHQSLFTVNHEGDKICSKIFLRSQVLILKTSSN